MSLKDIIKVAAKFEEILKEAAPKGVLDKKLWNKLEKEIRKSKSKYENIFAVIQKAYQKAGGKYSHKSKK